MIHIFTITARNYLSLALTLGDSIARHHPEARFTICVADGLDEQDNITNIELHPGHSLMSAQDLLPREQLETLAFKYNITEFCTAIKPTLFKALFADPSVDLVYYMDPDTFLYHRLDPIIEANPGKTLYLAPHLIDCRLADDHPYPEYKHLWEGIFNLGFCAIRRTSATVHILDWWTARLQKYCFADFRDGLHTDQKWMDYAPVFFGDELSICRHYGVNVAHWNIVERRPKLLDEKFVTRDQPLIFFHFSGFDFNGYSLTKHVPPELQRYIDSGVRGLADEYRSAVLANGYEKFISIPYRYGFYSDGVPVSHQHRRLFRALEDLGGGDDLFSASGSFRRKIERAGLLDNSSAAIKNHSGATLPNAGILHLRAQWLLRLVLRLIGPRRYVYMIKFFGLYGRFEMHAFLLSDSH